MITTRQGGGLKMLPDMDLPWQRCCEWSKECAEKEDTDILSMSGRVRRVCCEDAGRGKETMT